MTGQYDPADGDQHRREPLRGDNNPAALTCYQAQKCAAIIDAYRDGHEGYADHVRTVVRFLQAAALEGKAGRPISRPSTADLWPEIDALPWPPTGPPKPQPDVA